MQCRHYFHYFAVIDISITFDIDLKYGTCISLLVVDAAAWYNGIYRYTALYSEVQKDGVTI